MNEQKKTGIIEMHQIVFDVNKKHWFLSIVFIAWMALFLMLYSNAESLFKDIFLSELHFSKDVVYRFLLLFLLIVSQQLYTVVIVQTIFSFTKNETNNFLQLLKKGFTLHSFFALLIWIVWVPTFVITFFLMLLSFVLSPILLIGAARAGDLGIMKIPKYTLLIFWELNKALGKLYIYLLISLKVKDFEIKDFFTTVFVYQRSYFDPIKWIVPISLVFLTIPFLLMFAFFKLFTLSIVLLAGHYILSIITVYALTENPKYYGINVGLITEKIASQLKSTIKQL